MLKTSYRSFFPASPGCSAKAVITQEGRPIPALLRYERRTL
nr:MAG TPA: hypothetical protein [Caudoviricetes sp.]